MLAIAHWNPCGQARPTGWLRTYLSTQRSTEGWGIMPVLYGPAQPDKNRAHGAGLHLKSNPEQSLVTQTVGEADRTAMIRLDWDSSDRFWPAGWVGCEPATASTWKTPGALLTVVVSAQPAGSASGPGALLLRSPSQPSNLSIRSPLRFSAFRDKQQPHSGGEQFFFFLASRHHLDAPANHLLPNQRKGSSPFTIHHHHRVAS